MLGPQACFRGVPVASVPVSFRLLNLGRGRGLTPASYVLTVDALYTRQKTDMLADFLHGMATGYLQTV
jgi:hypothetical protein